MPQLTVNQVLSGADLGLIWGLTDLLVLEVGDRTVLYALGRTDSGLVEVTVGSDGTLTPVGVLALSGDFSVGSIPALGSYVDGGGTRLTLAGLDPVAGSFVGLDANGTLLTQFAEAGIGELAAPAGKSLAAGSAIVSGRSSAGGLDLFLDNGGGLSWNAGIDDDASSYLADVSASASFQIGSVDYLITASQIEDGVTVTEISSTGSLATVGSLGVAEGLPINTPTDIAVFQRLGETLAVIGASGTSSMSTLRIEGSGDLWLSDHVLDDSETRFQGVAGIDATTVGNFAFVAAGGTDGGVSLFTVLPGGRLVHIDTVGDDSSTTLYRVSSVTMTLTASAIELFVASALEPGLTRISFDVTALGAVLVGGGASLFGTALDDQLIGSDTDDTLDGGAGDDIIFDGQGADSMTGGSGADLFIFAQDGVADAVLDFERGVDRLDLSGFDFLYDVSQLTITPTIDGATLEFSEEVVQITTSDAAPLTAGDLTNADILNVDRPPVLTVHQEIIGGHGADTLSGGPGDDTIDGAAGNDDLLGHAGLDDLYGGDGHNFLDGGSENDTIDGGTGLDTIEGGSGDDFIDGGHGGDLIYGDEIV
ncbi:MAG: calcium-binding protein [Boseongicola sp.]